MTGYKTILQNLKNSMDKVLQGDPEEQKEVLRNLGHDPEKVFREGREQMEKLCTSALDELAKERGVKPFNPNNVVGKLPDFPDIPREHPASGPWLDPKVTPIPDGKPAILVELDTGKPRGIIQRVYTWYFPEGRYLSENGNGLKLLGEYIIRYAIINTDEQGKI